MSLEEPQHLSFVREAQVQVLAPEIPDYAVKLKVDVKSNNIRIDEEPLLRSLAKLRAYVKNSTDSTLIVLRTELESQVRALRGELQAGIQETSDELKGLHEQQELRLKVVEDNAQDSKVAVEKMLEKAKTRRASHDRPRLSIDGQLVPRSRSSMPVGKVSSGASPVVLDTVGGATFSPDDMGFHASSIAAPSTSAQLPESAEKTSESSETHPQDPTTASTDVLPQTEEEEQDGIQTLQEVEETPPDEDKSQASVGSFGSDAASDAARAFDAEVREVIEALQSGAVEVQNDIQSLKDNVDLKLQAISSELTELTELKKVESERSMDSSKIRSLLDERMDVTGVDLQRMGGELRELRQMVLRLETDDTAENAICKTQGQMAELSERIDRAALVDVIEPKIDRLGRNFDLLAQTCQKSDTELEAATLDVSQLYVKYNSCSQQLLQVPLRTELDERCLQLDQQCQSVSSLLKDVQVALGDISAAIISLSSKAEESDLVLVRNELSTFAENIKEREQSVLFGAKCLSCNRVFDEVCQEAGAGAVDLPVERQRDALFAHVQRALHSPNIDPMTKIKMLAVKVGRPMPLVGKGGSGTFEGRDGKSFSCGTGDVHLMPPVCGSSLIEDGRISAPPQRPASTPRPQKRRPGSRTDAWQASRKDGPLDYIHPLSQLLDRSQRSGRTSAPG